MGSQSLDLLRLAPSCVVGQHRFCVGEKAKAVDGSGLIGFGATPDGIEAASLRLAAGPLPAAGNVYHPFWRV